jgi:hypothetical protein
MNLTCQPADVGGFANLDAVINAVHGMYAQMHPRDRMDAVLVVHPRMREVVQRGAAMMRGWRPKPPPPLVTAEEAAEARVRLLTDAPPVDRLLGIRMETFDLPDWRTIELWAENDHDRALRRAQERGQIVNVVRPESFAIPDFPLPVKPTLGALLRHWGNRLRGRP